MIWQWSNVFNKRIDHEVLYISRFSNIESMAKNFAILLATEFQIT